LLASLGASISHILHPGILCWALPLGVKNMLPPSLSTRLMRPAVSWNSLLTSS